MAVRPASPATVQSPDRPTIPVTSPISGEVIGRVPHHTPEDVIAAVERVRAAQPEWAARPFRERAKVIKRFHDRLLSSKDEIMAVIQAEAGKSRRDAFVEIFAVAAEARYYACNGWRFLKPRRARPAIPLRNRVRVYYHPHGVVGIISPWNFPLILSVGDAIPALLAGNGVVVKPATLAPLSIHRAREELIECGLPEDLMQIVTGPGSEIGNTLIDHVDYVMFTGSTRVGRRVAERAARRLIPYSMELGGKNALIVLPDADLDHAAIGAVEGAFNNCGQVCINWERVYVDARVYDEFIARLIRKTEELRLGPGQGHDVDLGSLVNEEQVRAVEAHVQDAVSKGARILTGGRRRPDLGPCFYEPTILADVTPEMAVHSEETFGPVLSVYRVESLEEAIQKANDNPYGLHFGVFTRDRHRGERIATRLEAGSVSVNDTYINWAAMDAPMGGLKQSGLGRRHGPEGIRKYTEPQTIVINRTNLQIGSQKTALSFDRWLEDLLTFMLRVWRHIPLIR